MEKPQPVEVKPVEENNMIEVKTIKPQKVQNSDSEISGSDEIELQDVTTETQDIENDDELYEEIIFQDDFDKEYWEGTEDNYLEE